MSSGVDSGDPQDNGMTGDHQPIIAGPHPVHRRLETPETNSRAA
jgi:hypothetical protein